MSGFVDHSPPSPPPPSYEISQHEFDQKTSRVLEQSAEEPPPRRVDEDGFEIWDDALFEAALAGITDLSLGQASQSPQSLSPGSGMKASQTPSYHAREATMGYSASSLPAFSPSANDGSGHPQEKAKARERPISEQATGEGSGSGSIRETALVASPSPPSSPPQAVRPLRVNKRPTKERPSWYVEAGLGGGSPPPSPLQSTAGSSSGRQERPLRRQLTVFNNTERENTPPPEFTPVGPSLDGPPYEVVVMTYDGEPPPPASGTPGLDALSPPPSPPAELAMPVSRPNSVRPHPTHAQSLPAEPQYHPAPSPRPHPVVNHQSLPATSSVSGAAALRASAFEPFGKLSNAPRLAFNPQMAYTKPITSTMVARTEDVDPHVVNPSAFYSHAVSAQYSFNVPTHMRTPSQQAQPSYPHHYPRLGVAAPSNVYGACIPPDKAMAPVASPRPSYAYNQTNFQEPAPNPGAAWNYSAQQGWPPAGGGSHVYR